MSSRCKLASEVSSSLKNISSSPIQSVKHLEFNLKCLSTLIWSDSCGYFLFNKFLPEFLAGVMQLVFSPLCRKLLTTDQQAYDRLFFCTELDKLMKNSFKPVLLSELFVLQGCHKGKGELSEGFNVSSVPDSKIKRVKLPNAPVWLRNACGRVVSDTLWSDSKTGVLSLLDTVLTDNNDFKAVDVMALTRIDAVADIVLTVPKHKVKDDYLNLVVPQIWAIFCQCCSKVTSLNSEQALENYKKFSVTAIYTLYHKHKSFWESFVLSKFNDEELTTQTEVKVAETITSERTHQIVNWFDLLLSTPVRSDNSSFKIEVIDSLIKSSAFAVLFHFVWQFYSSNVKQPLCKRAMNIVSDMICACTMPLIVLNDWLHMICSSGVWIQFEFSKGNTLTGKHANYGTL